MTRRVDNLLALAVLSYLTQGPMHPYELGRTLQQHGDARSIRYRHASLYMVVDRLAAAGLILALDTERDGARPERTRYALTDAGRGELTDWLRELLAEPAYEYPHFVAALAYLGALPPKQAVAALDRRLVGLAAVRAEASEIVEQANADGVHPLFLVEEEYRLAVLDAEFSFVKRLRSRIEDPATGWRAAWSDPTHDHRVSAS
jgi:DNA-binding PadR family transcriptional regulator